MSELAAGGATRAATPLPDPRSASTAELVGSLKAKRPGVGAGSFGRAGLLALLELNALVPVVLCAGVQDHVAAVKEGIAR
jgi:hypothetical protein